MFGVISPCFSQRQGFYSSLNKVYFILVVIKLKFIDQRVKINPGRSKAIRLITLKNGILISFNNSDACARNL